MAFMKNATNDEREGVKEMRQKLKEENKRSTIIGIKVDKSTKAKIAYIADRDAKTMSTYINDLLVKHIEEYTRMTKTDWRTELEEGAE